MIFNMTLFKRSMAGFFSLSQVISLLTFCPVVHAKDGGITLDKTRVVISSERVSEKITLMNKSERVYLIHGKVSKTPESDKEMSSDIPFIIIPPLFRLESKSKSTVMIMRQDISMLPQDRESIFYLSFLAIPSISKPGDVDAIPDFIVPRVSVGIRSVIKLLYRPPKLAVPDGDAAGKLTFKQHRGMLYIQNPTPYYITLAQLRINGKSIDLRDSGAMLAPYSGNKYRFADVAKNVSWSAINDFGGISETNQALLSGK